MTWRSFQEELKRELRNDAGPRPAYGTARIWTHD